MKSKTSCFNKTIFKKNVTHFWPIWMIILAWNLFVMPFNIFNNYLNRGNLVGMTPERIELQKVNEIANLVEVYMNPGIILIFSIVAAMAVFSYLYTSRSANTFHALPVTRKELFITSYLSGLAFLLLPETVGFLTGTLVSAACGYTSLNYLLTGFFCAAGLSFFFYNFTVFAAMFAGQLFAVPVFTVIIDFLYIGCKSILYALMGSISYGMTGKYSYGKFDVLSPSYYMQYNIGISYDYTGEYSVCKGIYGVPVVAGYAIAGVVLVAAAYIIYQKRKMETTGNLISISWICPVFRWGAGFCGALLFSMIACQISGFCSAKREFAIAVIAALIFGIIFFYGAQMFLEKGFRVFTKKRFTECGVFLVVLIAVLFGIEFNLFGQESRIPKTSDIQKAYINGVYPVGGSKEEQIEMIRSLHQQIVDSKKEFEAYETANHLQGDNTWGINVKYFLKNGSVVERTYQIPASKEAKEDKNSVYNQFAEMTVMPESYLSSLFGINYEDIKLKSGNLDLYNDNDNYLCHDFTKEEVEKIYQAIIADIEAGNFKNVIMGQYQYNEDYQNHTYYNMVNIDYTSSDGIRELYQEYQEESQNRYYNSYSMDKTDIYSCSVSFDENCENLINTLIELGAINSEDDLITIQEKNEMDQESE